MYHSFDVDLAVSYGIPEAILLNHLLFWITKNEANGTSYHDGRYWTYNSARAFAELFPYLSQRRIQNALKHLQDEGLIQTGNYNASTYDRTLWYAFTEKGKCITQKREMEDAKKGNGNGDSGKCINTDIKPDIKPDIKHYESEFVELWAIYPRKDGRKAALTAYIRARRAGTPLEAIRDGIRAYAAKVQRERTEPRYIKQGSTYFRGECWNDVLDQPISTASYDIAAAETSANTGAPAYKRRPAKNN